MIEFGLKHAGSSRWKKKFPRQKIERESFDHLGMHEHFKFGYDRNYHYGYLSWKDLEHFFEANIGKNVDKVFSEYVKRARRFDHSANLRTEFYDALNPDKRWKSKYCIDSQNRIAKYKEKEKSKVIGHKEAYEYNSKHFPTNIKPYLKANQLVPFGEFYFREHWLWKKKFVYICSKDWYDTVLSIGTCKQFVRMNNMQKVYIPFGKYNAYGVPAKGYDFINVPTGRYQESSFGSFQIYNRVNIPYTTDKNPDYIFLVKGNFNQY